MVASRDFSDERGETVTLIVGKPDPDPAPGGDWRCPFAIIRPGLQGSVHYMYGVDSLQALILALGIVKATLALRVRTDGPLRWIGGGDLGLDYEITSHRDESS